MQRAVLAQIDLKKNVSKQLHCQYADLAKVTGVIDSISFL